MKKAVVVVMFVVLAGAGAFLAYRSGWLARFVATPRITSPTPASAPSVSGATTSPPAAAPAAVEGSASVGLQPAATPGSEPVLPSGAPAGAAGTMTLPTAAPSGVAPAGAATVTTDCRDRVPPEALACAVKRVTFVDPALPLPRLPISGHQGRPDPPFAFHSKELDHLPDVQTFQVPGTGDVTLHFEFAYREAAFKNELGLFRVDNAVGMVDGICPGDPAYLPAALKRAKVIFPSGSQASTPDVLLSAKGGDIYGFFLVQNDTLANLIVRNPNNEMRNSPLAFFSLDALNGDDTDHFVGFENRSKGYTQFGFEDLTKGGDKDFDDVVYDVSPALPMGRLLPPECTGKLQIVSAIQQTKASKNLEIILDASGSMKLPLGKSTRIGTARQVLREVLGKIPDDVSVGLRFYGHRYRSRQKETCTDTELVLPIQKLNRQAILSRVDNVKPRGETALVYSVLQTPADLKPVGGGSVILITDGEESCGGDPQAAARQLKEAGVDVTLNIVGFTLKGKAVQGQLAAFAEATGGQYYSAQNGEALTRALLIAATDKFPFVLFDTSGRELARGEAGKQPLELPQGDYRVVIQAATQELEERVTLTPSLETVLKVIRKGDRFAIER